MDPQSLASFLLEQLSEVHCDLADAPKAQAAVRMLECIQSGEFVLIAPAPVRSGNAVPAGALSG
jgi:hypothetical protein